MATRAGKADKLIILWFVWMVSILPILVAHSLMDRATWVLVLIFVWAIGWAVLCLILGRRPAPDSLRDGEE